AFCGWYVVPCGAAFAHAELRAERHAALVFDPHALTTASPHSAFARAVQKSASVAYDVGSPPLSEVPGVVSPIPAAQPRERGTTTTAQSEENWKRPRMDENLPRWRGSGGAVGFRLTRRRGRGRGRGRRRRRRRGGGGRRGSQRRGTGGRLRVCA